MKHGLLGPGLRVSEAVGLGWAREFAFLTNSLVRLRLLVPCSKVS